MIWTPSEVLDACEELKRAGLSPSFAEGDRVARGFADLGYEEFVILPSQRMMSLFTGQVTSLQEDHRGFFAFVPTVDQCNEILLRRGIGSLMLRSVNERTWQAEGQTSSGRTITAEGETVLEAFVKLLVLTYREGVGA